MMRRLWVFVCLSDFNQYCTKPPKPISVKLGGKVKHGPRKNPLHIGVDPSRTANPQI